MDGVIVDSMPFHTRAWDLYLRKLGLDATLMNQKMHGKHNDELLREFLPPDTTLAEIQRMGAEKEALYRELIAPQLETSLLPGIRTFLDRYQALPKAVASNAEGPNVQFVLREAKLAHHFRYATDGGQVKHGKPHPEIYLKTASLLQIDPIDCIVFEDSQTGIDAALAAGMTVIAINSHRATLHGQTFEADHFLEPQLVAWLEQQLT